MRLRLRLLYLAIASLWRTPMGFLDESVIGFRVLPNDIDVTRITNDRYIALMDLGRMDGVFRIGLLSVMLRKRWVPLATFATIRFRYPLKIFQKYQLRTQVIGWDDRTFYFEQTFERRGRVVATGYVCATCLSAEGAVPPDEVMAATGKPEIRPPETALVGRLRDLNDEIHVAQRKADPPTIQEEMGSE